MLFLRFIRVRLTLWYVLLLAVLLAVFSLGVYFALNQALDENLSDSLESRAAIVIALATVDGELGTDGVEVPGDPLEGEHFARVFDGEGQLVFDNSLPRFAEPPDPDAVAAALAGRRRFRDMDTGGEYLRVLTSPVVIDGEIVGAVEVGQSQGEVRETLSRLLLIIAVAYPLALIAAVVGGLWLAGRALSPIDKLTQSAREITAQSMSGQIDTSGPDDELGRLARTFDEMIGRLDESFRRQRQFTSDASHELRTPLTAIKGQIEVALQRDRSAEDYRGVLQGVNQEVERLVRLVGSLLSMARADAGQVQLERDNVRLDELLESAVAQVRPLADERQIVLSSEQEAGISLLVDQDLLLQLVLNLLDNALKYTPAGGSIQTSCALDGAEAVISVKDSGRGIAPEHLERIFDRFYRVERARSRADGGAGLGLSISRWIAEAHGGSLSVVSEVGAGSRFTVRLPLDN